MERLPRNEDRFSLLVAMQPQWRVPHGALKKCVQSQTFVMWRLWQIVEETKECNTTTYLAAVVADIAVPPSSASREFMHFCL